MNNRSSKPETALDHGSPAIRQSPTTIGGRCLPPNYIKRILLTDCLGWRPCLQLALTSSGPPSANFGRFLSTTCASRFETFLFRFGFTSLISRCYRSSNVLFGEKLSGLMGNLNIQKACFD